MGKLHELIAVEPVLKSAFETRIAEVKTWFQNAQYRYHAQIKRFDPLDELEKGEVVDRLAMTSTVINDLDDISVDIARYFDAVLQKESANQKATSDLVVGHQVLYSNVPATFLLGLEQKLARLRGMLEVAPVTSAGIEWVPDTSVAFKNVYKTKDPQVAFKTKKVIKPFVLYEATKDHPAQVDKLSEEVNVGTYRTTGWSGCLTSADKAQILGRIDNLIVETKKARQRANEQDVIDHIGGSGLMDYILNGSASVSDSDSDSIL